jgi:hypothetical protein
LPSSILHHPSSILRRASTLTEVLVALMITSIGLVSVATMFPLSILRSIKATQLTNATDVRFNAENLLDMYPDMIQNPQSRNPAYQYVVGNAATNIAAVDPPFPTPNYIIDPLGFAAISALNGGAGVANGGSAIVHQNHLEHWFGNDPSAGNLPPWPANPPGVPWVDTNAPNAAPSFGLARYPMTWRTMAQAHYLVTLPDSWPLQFDTIGGNNVLGTDPNAPGTQITQITLAGLNYGPTATPPFPSLRVVMFSADGTTSQIRNVTSLVYNAATNSTTVIWTEDLNGSGLPAGQDFNNNGVVDHYPLPVGFATAGVATPIGIVRLEAQDPRYTWLMTVRQTQPQTTPATANVDVVVFFNRSVENIGTDELLYDAGFSLGSTQVRVTYPTALNPATNLPLKPFMKKGGFVFDANNAYWYRISNVVDNPPGAATATSDLTLDVPANASNQGLKSFTGNPIPPRAMFPRNVVEVYPLGPKP